MAAGHAASAAGGSVSTAGWTTVTSVSTMPGWTSRRCSPQLCRFRRRREQEAEVPRARIPALGGLGTAATVSCYNDIIIGDAEVTTGWRYRKFMTISITNNVRKVPV